MFRRPWFLQGSDGWQLSCFFFLKSIFVCWGAVRIYIKRWKLFKETQHKIVGKMFEEIISQIQRQSVMKKLSTKSNSIEVYQYLRFFTKYTSPPAAVSRLSGLNPSRKA